MQRVWIPAFAGMTDRWKAGRVAWYSLISQVRQFQSLLTRQRHQSLRIHCPSIGEPSQPLLSGNPHQYWGVGLIVKKRRRHSRESGNPNALH
jgi:hypothetical protein